MAFVPIAMMAYDYAMLIGTYQEPRFIFFDLNKDGGGTARVTYDPDLFIDDIGSYSDDVVIPESFEYRGVTFAVTSIGEKAFQYSSGLTSVTIPNTVKSIGDHAFEQTGLVSINIPSSVKSIGNEAFAYSYDLESITLSEGLETIDVGAFSNCDRLTSIHIPSTVNSIGDGAFTASVMFSGAYHSISSITVAQGNKYYDSRDNCNAIIETATNKLIQGCKNTVVPLNVETIGELAFANSGIRSVVLSSSVKSIERLAFFGCGLDELAILNTRPTIDDDAFEAVSECDLYTPEDFYSGVTFTYSGLNHWKNGSFYWKPIRDFISLDGLYYNTNISDLTVSITYDQSLGEEYNSYSGNVVIPEEITFGPVKFRVTSIGENAFRDCDNLTSVTIPNTVKDLGSRTFYNSSLCSVTIPGSVETIGDEAFFFSALESVTISEGVKTIGSEAFADCPSLTSIHIPSTVTSIGDRAFHSNEVSLAALTSISVAPNNPVYDSRDYCNAIIETATNKLIFGCKKTVIPETVESIGSSAFFMNSLGSFEIPANVKSIESSSFGGDGLTSLTIYNNSISIADDAFPAVIDCDLYVPRRFDLGDYTVEGDEIKWKDGYFKLNRLPYDILLDGIYYTLDDDLKEAIVMYNNNDFQPSYSGDVEIPESITYNGVSYDVTNINSFAFYDCESLSSVIIPSSVRNVEFKAFGRCFQLTSLTFLGDNVTVGNSAFEGVGGRNTCIINVPEGFDFGDVDTSEGSFMWRDGLFQLPFQKISITAAGMATYCSPFDLDFTNVTGLKAYIIAGYDWESSKVYAMRVYDVPAGTGLYLVGAKGDYTVPFATSSSYYINMLVGTLEETWIEPTDGDLSNLRLTGSSPKDASFKTFTVPRTFSANRAYLQIPTNLLNHSANAVGIVFDDEVDGIDGISQNAGETDSNWFTLDGRKLNGKPTTKGVYVVKGKKVVVR